MAPHESLPAPETSVGDAREYLLQQHVEDDLDIQLASPEFARRCREVGVAPGMQIRSDGGDFLTYWHTAEEQTSAAYSQLVAEALEQQGPDETLPTGSREVLGKGALVAAFGALPGYLDARATISSLGEKRHHGELSEAESAQWQAASERNKRFNRLLGDAAVWLPELSVGALETALQRHGEFVMDVAALDSQAQGQIKRSVGSAINAAKHNVAFGHMVEGAGMHLQRSSAGTDPHVRLPDYTVIGEDGEPQLSIQVASSASQVEAVKRKGDAPDQPYATLTGQRRILMTTTLQPQDFTPDRFAVKDHVADTYGAMLRDAITHAEARMPSSGVEDRIVYRTGA